MSCNAWNLPNQAFRFLTSMATPILLWAPWYAARCRVRLISIGTCNRSTSGSKAHHGDGSHDQHDQNKCACPSLPDATHQRARWHRHTTGVAAPQSAGSGLRFQNWLPKAVKIRGAVSPPRAQRQACTPVITAGAGSSQGNGKRAAPLRNSQSKRRFAHRVRAPSGASLRSCAQSWESS